MTTISQSQLTSGRLAALVASRFVLNALFRIAYPLIPFVTTQYRISEATATWIVTVQVLAGLVTPLGGWLGDHLGYRRTMLLGLSCSLTGTLLVASAPTFLLLVIAFGVCGIGMSLYQPAMQAYVSALTPYHQRGRAVGLVELSWALAGIAAVPPLTWVVDRSGSLRIAFVALAVCLVGVWLATLSMPSEYQRHEQPMSGVGFDVILNRRVIGLLLFIMLAIGGNELLFIVQPTWATERFNAALTDLGAALFVFGIGEFGGSAASAAFTDRLGKRRAVMLGFGMAALIYLLLPVVSVSWIAYLACYVFFALFVEFGIVASLTLASTVSTRGRATVLALTVTSMQVGRAIGSRLGVPLYEAGSIGANALIAALLVGTAVVIVWRFVEEQESRDLYEGA